MESNASDDANDSSLKSCDDAEIAVQVESQLDESKDLAENDGNFCLHYFDEPDVDLILKEAEFFTI